MLIRELEQKRIVIWGTGLEGRAALGWIREQLPEADIVVVDEKPGTARTTEVSPPLAGGIKGGLVPIDRHRVCGESPPLTPPASGRGTHVLRDPAAIAAALSSADVVVKSPGVSLYHPLLEKEKGRGLRVTSLLNLWMAENDGAFVIGVTGTKGKSTTASLLAHALNGIGKRALALGNIGTPITACSKGDADYFIIEMSSYQAADFDGRCRLALLTSLYPEHLDWHGSLARYFRDKANLLAHSDMNIVDAEAAATLRENGIDIGGLIHGGPTPNPSRKGGRGTAARRFRQHENHILNNAYLMRLHNRRNVSLVVAAIDALGLDTAAALRAMEDYRGLPHRQQELGERNGVLFVDDSISTTPQSAVAALEVYSHRPVTLIAGGHDRGVDYAPLADYVAQHNVNAVVCIGDSGKRIYEMLRQQNIPRVFLAASMTEAVVTALAQTSAGGVILLSPAAPSFGMFRDYIDRAEAFGRAGGFL